MFAIQEQTAWEAGQQLSDCNITTPQRDVSGRYHERPEQHYMVFCACFVNVRWKDK